MNALETLQDDWLSEDESELLDALAQFIDTIGGAELTVGEKVTGADGAKRLAMIREQGWFEFIANDDTSSRLYAETIKRLHRRFMPVQAPVFEAFGAIRLLRASAEPSANELLSSILDGEQAPVLLDVNSLFEPAAPNSPGGAVPFGDTISSLTVVNDDDGLALHIVDPVKAEIETTPLIDPTLPAVRLTGGAERVASLSHTEWQRALAETLVAQASAFVGQSQSLFNTTIEFLGVREQFGVPIGSFQAIRHRAADIASELYAAQQLSIHIAEIFDEGSDRVELGLLGKALCGRVAVNVSSEAIQLRGGMGFTWEGGAHFGLKRIMNLALTGPSIEDAERELGERIIGRRRPRWAGGLNIEDGDNS